MQKITLLLVVFLIVGCGAKVVKEIGIDTKAIVPEYVIDVKELLGLPLKESRAKVKAMTDFRPYQKSDYSYAYFDREFGRTTPYFTETVSSSTETYAMTHKAYLALSQNLSGSGVGRVELTHSGVVSAEEALMMFGYDPKTLVVHPVGRSAWLASIDPYFHFIEVQWFDAEQLDRTGKLGKVTQIRVSVW